MAKTTAKVLTNFSVRRALSPTPGYMYSIMPDGAEKPVRVQETTVLGTQGQYGLKAKTPDAAVATNNIQAIEVAFLDPEASELLVAFNLKVHRLPSAEGANIEMCNIGEVEERLRKLNEAYTKAGGFRHLAGLYAERIASGAWLWRNRFGSDLEVEVLPSVDGEELAPMRFTTADQAASGELADLMGQGLAGEALVTLNVRARIDLGQGQEVYPSQEMANNTKVSRVFYKDEKGHAMMHSQKIGNALRTIDCWHPAYDLIGELPVEPYGSSIKKQDAYRFSQRSFYTLLKQVVAGSGPLLEILNAKSVADLDKIEDSHYFFAMLVRGGVFGMKAKGAA